MWDLLQCERPPPPRTLFREDAGGLGGTQYRLLPLKRVPHYMTAIGLDL